MTYDVTDHPLLSAKAKALVKNSDAFEAYTSLAAELLGVADTTYTGLNLAKISRAVAREVGWLLELNYDVLLHKQAASSQSKQTITYRDVTLIDPIAAAIVSAVNAVLSTTGSSWADCRAIR